MIDPRRLELLMHVADFGSFSRSAAVLGIAQPALGRQIQKLEEACGVKLLYRHGRGVSLTPEGLQLVERAKPLLRQLDALTQDLQADTGAVRGTVVLGLTPTACDLLGLRLLTSLSEQHPELAVNIVSGYSGYVHEWLVNGRLDIAVLHDARRSATVAVEPVGAARLYLITPPGKHIGLDASTAVPVAALGEVPLALPGQNHGLRRTLDVAASEADVTLQVRYEVNTLRLMLDLVVAGEACTVLARPAYLRLLRQGLISEYAIDSPSLQTRLMMAEASNRPVTRAMRVVRHDIQRLLAALMRDESETYGLMPLD